MKGLIIKDLMCLRRQRITYIYIVLVVLIVSVMYVLSAKYGNLAMAGKEMMVENNMTDIDVKNLSTLALIMFMILPLAMVGDISSVFIADGKAGFSNVSAILPLSIEKRVLAKYLTLLSFFGIGVATDTLISFVLSLLTDIISFTNFLQIIVTSASILFIYGSMVCVYMYIFGYGKESYAQTCSILSIIFIFVVLNFQKVKIVFLSCISDDMEVLDVNPIEIISEYAMDYTVPVLMLAILIGILSYALSVIIAKYKRGIV